MWPSQRWIVKLKYSSVMYVRSMHMCTSHASHKSQVTQGRSRTYNSPSNNIINPTLLCTAYISTCNKDQKCSKTQRLSRVRRNKKKPKTKSKSIRWIPPCRSKQKKVRVGLYILVGRWWSQKWPKMIKTTQRIWPWQCGGRCLEYEQSSGSSGSGIGNDEQW